MQPKYESDIGKTFYHVAHPTVPCILLGLLNDNWVSVRFSQSVGFKGNPTRDAAQEWDCSSNLLYSSPEEARRNSWDNSPSGSPPISMGGLLLEV